MRELENLVERAVTLSVGPNIELRDLPAVKASSIPPPETSFHDIPDEGIDLDGYLNEIEKSILIAALKKSGGVRKRAADLLGMSFRSLRYRLAKYGFSDSEEDPAPNVDKQE